MKVFGQLESAQLENVTADPTPTASTVGRVVYRSDTDEYKICDSTPAWRKLFLSEDDSLTFTGLAATPGANPVSGKFKVYFKTDGKPYYLDENGSELPLGSGSGSGTKNYVPDDSIDIESNIGSWLTDDGAGTASTLISLATTAVVGEVLTGVSSLKGSKTAVDADGHFYKLASDTVDPADRGATFQTNLQFKPLTGYVSNDLRVVMYDLTNDAELNSFGVNELPNLAGKVSVIFETLGSTEQIELRLEINNTNTNAFDFSIDEFSYGPLSTFEIKNDGPVGEVIAYPADDAPDGFVYCDGAAVSRTTYADLFAIIGITHGQGDGSTTFNVPNYKGRFLRGQADGSGLDPDRASRTAMNTGGNTGDNVGSVQGDELQSHRHSTMIRGSGNNNSLWHFDPTAGSRAYASAAASDGTGGYYNTYMQDTGGNETRPHNANVKFFIRYKSSKNIFTNSDLALKSDFVRVSSVGANQTLTDNAVSVVSFPDVIKDLNGSFNVSTNRYVAPTDGMLNVDTNVHLQGMDGVSSLANMSIVVLDESGATIDSLNADYMQTDPNPIAGMRNGISYPVKKGWQVEINVFLGSGGASTFVRDDTNAWTWATFSLQPDIRLFGAVQNVGDAVPAGTLIQSMAVNTPEGYLYCDGSEVNRADYPRLFAAIGTAMGVGNGTTTFNLPNMKGVFARGQDDGEGLDPNAGTRSAYGGLGGNSGDNVGTYQGDIFGAHNHSPIIMGGGNGTANFEGGGFGSTQWNNISRNINNLTTQGGSETRPRNVSVRYYVRY